MLGGMVFGWNLEDNCVSQKYVVVEQMAGCATRDSKISIYFEPPRYSPLSTSLEKSEWMKLHVSAVPIPPPDVSESDIACCFDKNAINLLLRWLVHCKLNIYTIPSQSILHSRKQKLNWIVIWGIRGQEFAAHAPENDTLVYGCHILNLTLTETQ